MKQADTNDNPQPVSDNWVEPCSITAEKQQGHPIDCSPVHSLLLVHVHVHVLVSYRYEIGMVVGILVAVIARILARALLPIPNESKLSELQMDRCSEEAAPNHDAAQ